MKVSNTQRLLECFWVTWQLWYLTSCKSYGKKKGLYRCLWSPESLGIFSSQCQALLTAWSNVLLCSCKHLIILSWQLHEVGTSFIGLRPADSKCLPWEAGSCSLCYITVLSWSALSVHTCIFWGQHLNSCYQEFQGLTVLFITLGDTFLHSKCLLSNAQRELSSLVQLDAQLLWFRRRIVLWKWRTQDYYHSGCHSSSAVFMEW